MNKMDIAKRELIKELNGFNISGILGLLEYMDKGGYFEAPASSKWHGAFEGGLFGHCMSVYTLFNKLLNDFHLTLSVESQIICALTHDLCKMGLYLPDGKGGYSYNINQPKGHALLSIKRIGQFIQLREDEKEIIKFHMGMYGTFEFNKEKGEYTMAELVEAYNRNKIAKLFYFCDDMSSQFMEE